MPDLAGRLPGVRQVGQWLILLCVIGLIVAFRGATLLHDHSLHSIDGAMQTWFALDNFASANQLGVEFQSYLGITMILALLPGFWAFGETLYASTMSAYLWVILGAFGSAYAVVWMTGRFAPHQRWFAALVLVFTFYYFGPFVAEIVGLRFPLSFDPGVSLRPIRGVLPFLVLTLFVIALRSILTANGWRQSALAGAGLGCAAGIGLLWSNDAGIPLVIALAIGLGSALLTSIRSLIAALAGFVVATPAAAIAVVLLVTHGEPAGWLHYNFVAVAGDQFWFFAPWDRASRVLAISDLARIPFGGELLSALSLVSLISCIVIALIMRLRRSGDPVRLGALIFVGSSLVGTAMLPQIGGHIGGEYNHITFLIGLCAPLILLAQSNLAVSKNALAGISPAGAMIGLVLAGGAMVASEAWRYATIPNSTDRTVYAPQLGFYVTQEHAADLEAMDRLGQSWDTQGIAADRQMLSVYTSSLDIAAGTQSPAPVGSLIHALGDQNREDYVSLVSESKVEAVITIAPDYSGWEGWLLRSNWPFFRALLESYTPIARNDQHVLWVRSNGRRALSATIECSVEQVSESALRVTLISEFPGWASIALQRQGSFSTGRTALLTVTETSPQTTQVQDEPWSDFPRYGVANAPSLELVAPVEARQETALLLEVLDGSEIGSAQCSAELYKAPDLKTLDSLPVGVDRYLGEQA